MTKVNGVPDKAGTAPNSASHWPFPFPPPGKSRARDADEVPILPAHRWPYRPLADDPIVPRGVRSPVGLAEFKRAVGEWCDDVGVISIDDPALDHERAEIRYVYPHARSLVCMIGEENKAAMQSRYLPSANNELYRCEERLWEMGRRTVKHVNALGGEGLTTTIGWPMEVGQRWADKIWPLSHKLVAQAAGLGVIGTSRNFLHRKFGAYCLIDTVVTNLEFDAYDGRVDWNPCLQCNLCIASCPTDAIKPDGNFDFFACYNHTYRDSIPGFLDLVQDLAEAKPKRFRKRWTDNEIAALWQAMAFKVEYRCFNCVATCPAEIETVFHGERETRRRYLDETLKPLTYTRSVEDQQFVIDTPAARERLDVEPGEWRTPVDRAGVSSAGARLVSLRRIRTQNVDAMMRWMPQYFRAEEARGLAFTTQFELTGAGGGQWAMRIASGHCDVRPGTIAAPDLVLVMPATYFLALHRGEANPVWGLLSRRIRLRGRRRLFLLFPRLFPTEAPSSIASRWVFRARRWRRATRGNARSAGQTSAARR